MVVAFLPVALLLKTIYRWPRRNITSITDNVFILQTYTGCEYLSRLRPLSGKSRRDSLCRISESVKRNISLIQGVDRWGTTAIAWKSRSHLFSPLVKEVCWRLVRSNQKMRKCRAVLLWQRRFIFIKCFILSSEQPHEMREETILQACVYQGCIKDRFCQGGSFRWNQRALSIKYQRKEMACHREVNSEETKLDNGLKISKGTKLVKLNNEVSHCTRFQE